MRIGAGRLFNSNPRFNVLMASQAALDPVAPHTPSFTRSVCMIIQSSLALRIAWWRARRETLKCQLDSSATRIALVLIEHPVANLIFSSEKERVLLKPLRVRACASRQQFLSRCVER